MGSKLLRNSEENAGVAEKVDGSFIEDEGSSTGLSCRAFTEIYIKGSPRANQRRSGSVAETSSISLRISSRSFLVNREQGIKIAKLSLVGGDSERQAWNLTAF